MLLNLRAEHISFIFNRNKIHPNLFYWTQDTDNCNGEEHNNVASTFTNPWIKSITLDAQYFHCRPLNANSNKDIQFILDCISVTCLEFLECKSNVITRREIDESFVKIREQMGLSRCRVMHKSS